MKKRVAFVCVHNSCRSQIAEALRKIYGKSVFKLRKNSLRGLNK